MGAPGGARRNGRRGGAGARRPTAGLLFATDRPHTGLAIVYTDLMCAGVEPVVINRGFFGRQRCRYAVQVCGDPRSSCSHYLSAYAVPWNVCISLASSFHVM